MGMAEKSAARFNAVRFDFTAKQVASLTTGEVRAAMASGAFVWLDIEYVDAADARRILTDLEVPGNGMIDGLFNAEANTFLSRQEESLHLVVADCQIGADGTLTPEPVHVVMTQNYLLTLHDGPRAFMNMVRQEYASDFVRFAQSPSFLIYELWDHLVEHYVSVQERLESGVRDLQRQLFADDDEAVFKRVAAIGANLLHFRAVLAPARGVLTELSTRRSIFLSEATRAALANMVSVIDHVMQDVMVDRDILTQSLNLHMSMVSHRTNRIMGRLTLLSALFLPLTFLCGVYGMNFETFPELHWRYGYLFFWMVAGSIVGVLVWLMRHHKLL